MRDGGSRLSMMIDFEAMVRRTPLEDSRMYGYFRNCSSTTFPRISTDKKAPSGSISSGHSHHPSTVSIACVFQINMMYKSTKLISTVDMMRSTALTKWRKCSS